VEQLVRAFLSSLETQQTYAQNTLLGYSSDLSHLIAYLEEKLKRAPVLDDFRLDMISGFVEAERKAGRRRNTLLRRRATLRQFAEFLTENGHIEEDTNHQLSEHIDSIIAEVSPSQRERCLSPEHINRLMEIFASDQRPQARRDQVLIAILLETGLSVSQLVNLDLDDLDLEEGKLRLPVKHGKYLWVSIGSAREVLKRYLREGRPDLNCAPNEPALFISQMGKRLSRQGIWQILRHWGQRAGIPDTLSPRRIRHTAALRLANAGHSIGFIQVLLGHRNPLSTQALLRRLDTSCGKV
jgi:integrase/recombinase XerD